jgi:molybdopterin biosynthesis enzyme
VGFEALVRPALARLAGDPAVIGSCIPARAASRIVHHPGRTEFAPVVLGQGGGSLVATPLGWSHAADLRGTTSVDAFAILEPGARSIDADEVVCVRATR